MATKGIIIAILLIVPVLLQAQSISKKLQKLNLETSVAMGVSRFHSYQFPAMPDYTTAELQVLIIGGRQINNNWMVSSGIGISYKFNRQSYFWNEYPNDTIVQRVTDERFALPRMDETVSEGGRMSLDIPLYFTYKRRNSKIRFGPIVRFWGTNRKNNIDLLANQTLLGFQAEVIKKISNRNEIGLRVHHDIFSVFSISIYDINGKFLDLDTYYQILQIRVAHKFY